MYRRGFQLHAYHHPCFGRVRWRAGERTQLFSRHQRGRQIYRFQLRGHKSDETRLAEFAARNFEPAAIPAGHLLRRTTRVLAGNFTGRLCTGVTPLANTYFTKAVGHPTQTVEGGCAAD